MITLVLALALLAAAIAIALNVATWRINRQTYRSLAQTELTLAASWDLLGSPARAAERRQIAARHARRGGLQ